MTSEPRATISQPVELTALGECGTCGRALYLPPDGLIPEHEGSDGGCPGVGSAPVTVEETVPRLRTDVSMLLRLGWTLLFVVIALTTSFNFSEVTSPDAVEVEARLVRTLADAQGEAATGAPQQQVVNGWHAADLLELQTKTTAEGAQASADLRLLVFLGLFWWLGDRTLFFIAALIRGRTS